MLIYYNLHRMVDALREDISHCINLVSSLLKRWNREELAFDKENFKMLEGELERLIRCRFKEVAILYSRRYLVIRRL